MGEVNRAILHRPYINISSFRILWTNLLWGISYVICKLCLPSSILPHDLKRWLENQHLAMWRGLGSTRRQAQELISGPYSECKDEILSLNRTQSRIMIGLLAGHNTQRRYLHLMGLINSPLHRWWWVKDATSAHIVCECEALASTQTCTSGFLFLGSTGHYELWVCGPSGTTAKEQGSLELLSDYGAQRAC